LDLSEKKRNERRIWEIMLKSGFACKYLLANRHQGSYPGGIVPVPQVRAFFRSQENSFFLGDIVI
jgi:hypothetical protein